jgi:hypothetical protein
MVAMAAASIQSRSAAEMIDAASSSQTRGLPN